MPELEEMLARYGEAVEVHLLADEPPELPPVVEPRHARSRPARHRTLGIVAAAAAVLALVVAAVALRSDEHASDVATASTPSPSGAPAAGEGLFAEPTGLALVLSDGLDGAVFVDLDAARAARVPLDGERAGDPPARLILTDDHLVVGWGEIWAVPLAGGESTLVDRATIVLPAAETGQVWTLTWPSGGIGGGPVAVRRVLLDGTVRAEGTLDADRYGALIGAPGGLLVRTEDGSVGVWDPETEEVASRYPGPTTATASSGREVATCTTTCAELRAFGLAPSGPATAPYGTAQRLAFSPDGDHLAVLRPDDDGSELELIVEDRRAAGESVGQGPGDTVVAHLPTPSPPDGAVAWSPDGRQVVLVATTTDGEAKIIGVYDVGTGIWQQTVVEGLGGSDGALVVPRGDVAPRLDGDLVGADECPAPIAYPSGRDDDCTFALQTR